MWTSLAGVGKVVMALEPGRDHWEAEEETYYRCVALIGERAGVNPFSPMKRPAVFKWSPFGLRPFILKGSGSLAMAHSLEQTSNLPERASARSFGFADTSQYE